MATISALYRYPIKGFAPQRLDAAELHPGETIAFDRKWAVENGPSRFDPANPKTLPKISFLMLMRNERLAALGLEFDEDAATIALFRDGRQVVKGALNTIVGRQLIEQFLAGYMADDLRGPPRILHAPGHSFSDVSARCVHVVNLASVRELERIMGRTVDPLRFRANVYVDGIEPWSELRWLDREIGLGGARLEVIDRTGRCEATNVDPSSGLRDMAIPAALTRALGNKDFGIYAVVREGATVRPGDGIIVPA